MFLPIIYIPNLVILIPKLREKELNKKLYKLGYRLCGVLLPKFRDQDDKIGETVYVSSRSKRI